MQAREIAVLADTVRLVVEYTRICMTRFFPQPPPVSDTVAADKIVLSVYERSDVYEILFSTFASTRA